MSPHQGVNDHVQAYIPAEAISYCNKQKQQQLGNYCYLAQRLLMSNPQGLTKQTVQVAVGISAKTASCVLGLVAWKKTVSIIQNPKEQENETGFSDID